MFQVFGCYRLAPNCCFIDLTVSTSCLSACPHLDNTKFNSSSFLFSNAVSAAAFLFLKIVKI